MIRQEANIAAALDRASPRSLFTAIGWTGLPAPIQQAIAAIYGGTDKTKAALST